MSRSIRPAPAPAPASVRPPASVANSQRTRCVGATPARDPEEGRRLAVALELIRDSLARPDGSPPEAYLSRDAVALKLSDWLAESAMAGGPASVDTARFRHHLAGGRLRSDRLEPYPLPEARRPWPS